MEITYIELLYKWAKQIGSTQDSLELKKKLFLVENLLSLNNEKIKILGNPIKSIIGRQTKQTTG